jgi:hypothetical protein
MIRLTILLATITIAAALATPAYAEQQWCVMTCAKGALSVRHVRMSD